MSFRKIFGAAGLGLWLLGGVLAAGERVPGWYVVELNGEPVAAQMARQPARGRLRMAGAGVLRQREAVRAEQERARTMLEQRGAVVHERVETVANALIVEMKDEEAGALGRMQGVRRVLPVREFRMVLNEALPVHKVQEAWSLAGGEEGAGAGVKIAIIDSGVDVNHPAFQASGMEMPDGFPKVTNQSDTSLTNPKVIVARSYVDLLRFFDPDPSAQDHVGHGTALAEIAAGVGHEGPMGWVSGVAPRAYIGNYRIFGTPGFNDTTTDAAILKAIDDAVADGMDIINLSLGSDFAPRLEEDIDVEAVENAVKAGVVVVVAAGNNGPGWNTISSPATAPSAIAVGAVTNARTFGSSIQIEGQEPLVGIPGTSPVPAAPVSGAMGDVAVLDETGLACGQLPDGSLSGKVALILRGACTFETKLNNAQAAGAAGAVVYAAAESPSPITMSVGTAALPAQMVSNQDGVRVKGLLAAGETLMATMDFSNGPVKQKAGRVAEFSAVGPNVDLGLKPELVAVGTDMWIATQTLDSFGDMYDPSGYTVADGTSFSSPLVAGAVAVVKSARPGLTPEQYRSAIVNSAAPASDEASAWLVKSGSGLLDVEAAVKAGVAASPAALSFGAGAPDEEIGAKTLTLLNTGGAEEIYAIRVEARRGAVAPVTDQTLVTLPPGGTAAVAVAWPGRLLEAGTFEGYVVVEGQTTGTVARVPYWRASTTREPARITLMFSAGQARRGRIVSDAILFRVVDESGALAQADPVVEVADGGGAVLRVNNYDADVPGVYGVTVGLGFLAGNNVFRIRAGNAEALVTITGF